MACKAEICFSHVGSWRVASTAWRLEANRVGVPEFSFRNPTCVAWVYMLNFLVQQIDCLGGHMGVPK